MNNVYKAFDVLFHPTILVTITGLLLISRFSVEITRDALLFLSVLVLFCSIYYTLRRFTQETDKAYVLGIIGGVVYYFFVALIVNQPIQLLALMATILVITPLGYCIRRYWKVSAHVAMLTVCTLIITLFIEWYLFILTIFIPLVAWTRLKLNVHSLSQVVGGFFVGCLMLFLYLVCTNLLNVSYFYQQ